MKISIHKNPPMTPCDINGLNKGDYIWCALPGSTRTHPDALGTCAQHAVASNGDSVMMGGKHTWEKFKRWVVSVSKAGDELHFIDWDNGNISFADARNVMIPEIHLIRNSEVEARYDELIAGMVKVLWKSSNNDGKAVHNLKKLLRNHCPNLIDLTKPVLMDLRAAGVPGTVTRKLNYLWDADDKHIFVYRNLDGTAVTVRVPFGTNICLDVNNKVIPQALVCNEEDLPK